MARMISSAWRTEPALFKITPLSWTCGSKVLRPCTIAAAVRETCEMSSTKITGAEIRPATCAVEANPSPPICPSNRPITPSTTAMSAGCGVIAPCSSSGTI